MGSAALGDNASVKTCSSRLTSFILSPLPGACSRIPKATRWAEWDSSGVGKAGPEGRAPVRGGRG